MRAGRKRFAERTVFLWPLWIECFFTGQGRKPFAGLVHMGITMNKRMIALTAAILVCAGMAGKGEASQYHAAFYWARNSPDRFMDIITRLSPEFRSSYLVALAFGRTLCHWKSIRFEVEGQGVLHTGMQKHLETNVVAVARWMDFPWDRFVDTRFAFGEGLSYAFRRPYLEPRKDPEAEKSVRLLNYLMVELEFVLPGLFQWSQFIRVHHRSGAVGLFGGVAGGSNFIGTGIRYSF